MSRYSEMKIPALISFSHPTYVNISITLMVGNDNNKVTNGQSYTVRLDPFILVNKACLDYKHTMQPFTG